MKTQHGSLAFFRFAKATFAAGTSALTTDMPCGKFWLLGVNAVPNAGSIVYTLKAQSGVTFNPDGSFTVTSGTQPTVTASSPSSDTVVIVMMDA